MRRHALLLCAAVLAAVAVAVPASAVIGGTPDGQNHPYVAYVRNTQSSCTGAAVSPTLVVTAAHCFTFPTDRVWLTFDTDRRAPAFPGGFLTGTWHAHPDWCAGNGTCTGGRVGFDSHDVAVVVLDEPVSLPRYAHLPAAGLVDTLPNGTRVDSVGYGVEGFVVGGGKPAPARTSGLRMLAESVLSPSEDAISAEYLKLSANNAQGKGGICFGDSGGPNLLAGTDTILGINSFVGSPRCNGVTYSNRADLGYVLDFVASFED